VRASQYVVHRLLVSVEGLSDAWHQAEQQSHRPSCRVQGFFGSIEASFVICSREKRWRSVRNLSIQRNAASPAAATEIRAHYVVEMIANARAIHVAPVLGWLNCKPHGGFQWDSNGRQQPRSGPSSLAASFPTMNFVVGFVQQDGRQAGRTRSIGNGVSRLNSAGLSHLATRKRVRHGR